MNREEIKEELRKEYAKLQEKKEERLTIGQKIADQITNFGGSWSFIFILAGFLFLWIALNTTIILYKKWDPYPFILLNLFLSFLAAFQAPIILMSQKRETERDRIKSEEDYIINKIAEMEVADMQNDLEIIKSKLNNLEELIRR